jgi:hypothetical protein
MIKSRFSPGIFRALGPILPALLVLSLGGCCQVPNFGKESKGSKAAGETYAVGDRIQVTWKGKLYPAVILSVEGDGRYKIHYEGYGNEWDEVVGLDRIKGRSGGPTNKTAAPTPVAPPAPVAGRMASDGLPEDIPGPGSNPPTITEWNAVAQEVRVRGSSDLGCETKMLREWLRVNCKPKPNSFPPSNVQTVSSDGQQAYVGVYGNTTSAVVQVVRGKSYRGLFAWGGGRIYVASDLIVHWPSHQARPSIYFQDAKR